MHNEWHKLHMPKPYESLPSMRTYIHNSWIWTGGERREEGLTKCLHGVICVHQGILLSYYWTLLYEELTVRHKEDTGICGEQFKMETLNNTTQKHRSSICYGYWGVTGVCWGGVSWWWTRWLDELDELDRDKPLHVVVMEKCHPILCAHTWTDYYYVILFVLILKMVSRSQLHHIVKFKCSIIIEM